MTTQRPATLASLTSTTTYPSKKTFVSKFQERQKKAENPYYKSPPNPVNINSSEEFPTLGSTYKHKKISVVDIADIPKPKQKFADLARDWAVKAEKDELEEEKRIRDEMIRECEAKRWTLLKQSTEHRKIRIAEVTEDLEKEFHPIYNDDDLDTYSSVSEGNPEDLGSDGDEFGEEGEYNPGVVRDRRHNDDLY